MNIRIGLALALLLSNAAPAAGDDAQAVRAARHAQNAAIVAHRLADIAAYWTDDVTICRALGAQVAGKAEYLKQFAADDPRSPDTILFQREPDTVSVSDTWPLAFESGRFTGRRGGAAGAVIIRGRYSAQWVKRDGRWLIRSEVYVALQGAGVGRQLQAAP